MPRQRKSSRPTGTLCAALLAAAALHPAAAQERLAVVSVDPAPRALAAPPETAITVVFDRPVDRSSVGPASFWAFGRWSGPAAGSYGFGAGGRRVTLLPERRFSAGESVTVLLSHDLRGADGSRLRATGYAFQFWVRSRGSGFDFRELGRLSTRNEPTLSSRAYGGIGSDLDGDGFLDLTIVNEDTDDLRVFLNRGNHSGRLRRFLRPPTPTGRTPSPSEPGDFDRDGKVDVAVANTGEDTVSVLLGRGDGTFAPARSYEVGGEPRGIAVLDADGDGDLDLAATSFAEGRVVVRLNDGSGGFDQVQRFGTGAGERALAAGDLNGDGVLDLVVGLLSAGEIHVYAGNGDGTFTRIGVQQSGGEVWMLVVGDVDGDGDEDVAAVNSRSNNGAILLGDGAGGLAEPRVISTTDPFPLAADLADLDGDGDLDWVMSSFLGDWVVFANDGAGGFARGFAVAAPEAASCALAMDLDNDGALDLALVDELADEVVLMRNRAIVFTSGFDSGDTSDWSRARGSVAVVSPGLRETAAALEVTADGSGRRSYVQSNDPMRETSLSVQFDLDPRLLGLDGGAVEIFRLGGRRAPALMKLEGGVSGLRVRLLADDGGAMREIGSVRVRPAGASRLRLEWSSATGRSLADGRAALWKNGRLQAVAVDLANYGQRVDRVRLGLPTGSRAAAGGSLLFDRYLSTR